MSKQSLSFAQLVGQFQRVKVGTLLWLRKSKINRAGPLLQLCRHCRPLYRGQENVSRKIGPFAVVRCSQPRNSSKVCARMSYVLKRPLSG